MKALVFNIRLNSLYSIRIPFTWQSALTYPVLPPSAVIGLLANALQRYKNDKHPLEYLDLIENKTLWAGSRLLSPCIIKSYTTSAIVKWEDTFPCKFTNALCRQFAYSQQLQIVAIFKDESLINELIVALKTSPLTCGDSESLITIDDEILIGDVSEVGDQVIITEYPLPFSKETIVKDGSGRVYLMHERCKKGDTGLPLRAYLIPIEEREGIFYPSSLEIERTSEKVFMISNAGYVVTQELLQQKKAKKRKK